MTSLVPYTYSLPNVASVAPSFPPFPSFSTATSTLRPPLFPTSSNAVPVASLAASPELVIDTSQIYANHHILQLLQLGEERTGSYPSVLGELENSKRPRSTAFSKRNEDSDGPTPGASATESGNIRHKRHRTLAAHESHQRERETQQNNSAGLSGIDLTNTEEDTWPANPHRGAQSGVPVPSPVSSKLTLDKKNEVRHQNTPNVRRSRQRPRLRVRNQVAEPSSGNETGTEEDISPTAGGQSIPYVHSAASFYPTLSDKGKIKVLINYLRALFGNKNKYKKLLDGKNNAQKLLDMFQRASTSHYLKINFTNTSSLLALKYRSRSPVGLPEGTSSSRPKGSQVISREAILWSQLCQPNLLPFYGIYSHDGRIRFVTPWMENGDIGEYLRRNQSSNRVVLAYDTAQSLEFLPENGVIHGDLKGESFARPSAARITLGLMVI
ncbi:hypothetical protein C0995_013461 [Termitomyces sp. Mi166|nr:hypothetical protein C0995_013461 [Termitomyces sp. Mi166\